MQEKNKDTNESIQRLQKAFVISMLAIFFVLITMFNSIGQPFVIMAAIPLDLQALFLLLRLLEILWVSTALMGVIGLGIVVNDSIVLVNFINKRREDTSDH